MTPQHMSIHAIPGLRMRWASATFVTFMAMVGLSACGGGGTGSQTHSVGGATRPGGGAAKQNSDPAQHRDNPNPHTRGPARRPVRSCAALSVDDVHSVAPGATGGTDSAPAFACYYSRLDRGGTLINRLTVTLIPPVGRQMPAGAVRQVCEGTIEDLDNEASTRDVNTRQRPIPGFGADSLALASAKTNQFNETETIYSATWLQSGVCANFVFFSKEPRPASFSSFMALARLLASGS